MHLLSRKKNKSKFSPLRKIEKTENNSRKLNMN